MISFEGRLSVLTDEDEKDKDESWALWMMGEKRKGKRF